MKDAVKSYFQKQADVTNFHLMSAQVGLNHMMLVATATSVPLSELYDLIFPTNPTVSRALANYHSVYKPNE